MGPIVIYLCLFLVWVTILAKSSYKPGGFYKVRDFLVFFAGATLLVSFVFYAFLASAEIGKRVNFVLVCIDRVEYIATGIVNGGLTPHLKPDGTLHTCED